ncbi:MAG: peptide-binding protein [bacterium]
MKKVKVIILGILSTLVFVSCEAGYQLKEKYVDKPAYGDTIVEASIGEPATLNPILASDSSSFDIIGMVFNGLIKYDKDLKLTGDLAEKWKVSPNGLKITFYLKKGVLFHDNVEFTAEDVKFTYEKFMDPKAKTAYRSLFELVQSIKIIDKYTLVVTYKKPFAPALETWGAAILPKHLLEGKDINTDAFGRNPVGTGPYVFKKWITASKIELTANPTYFEGSPYIKNYIYNIIPDQAAQYMGLQAGNIDEMGMTPDQYFSSDKNKNVTKNFNKFQIPAFSFVYIGYNEANKLFASKKVRQALAYAINKQEIIDIIRRGLARPITGPFIPGTYAYNEAVKGYDYDPEKSKTLLAEAGWKPGKDGILEKDSIKFSFTLLTNQGNKEREQIATIVQQQLSKLGITVEVRVLAWNIFITEFVNKRKFDALVMGWSLSRDPDCYDIWHSSKTGENEFNFISYKNPQVDRLLEAGRTTFDLTKRKQSYNKIHAIIAEDAPYTFLYTPLSTPAIHKRFHGIIPAPAGLGYNFTKWYVPEEIQKYK